MPFGIVDMPVSFTKAPWRAIRVVLHKLEGTAHYDVFLQTDDNPSNPLLSFRTETHPNAWHTQTTHWEPTPDHRGIYMTYAGDISNGRGSISHVCYGLHQLDTTDSKTIRLILPYGHGIWALEKKHGCLNAVMPVHFYNN